MQRFIRWKRIVLPAAIIVLAGIVVRDLYTDQKDDIEEYYVEEVLRKTPQNLNAAAIGAIRGAIGARGDFQFIVLGDSQGRQSVFRKILTHAMQHKPDFIIHTGDMTSSGKYHQYLEFVDMLEETPVPVVCILGNHDDNNLGEQCFANLFGPHNYYFTLGQYLFAFLDNNESDTLVDCVDLGEEKNAARSYAFEDGLADHQIEYLQQLMKQGRKTFITMHKPPPVEPFRFHSFERNTDRFLSLMAQYQSQVAAVFCGHIHGYGETRHEGVQYIVSGGAGGDPVKDKEGITGAFNYVLVTVRDGQVYHRVYYPRL